MRIFRLVNATARAGAITAIGEAPEGYVVKIGEPVKTREQEEKYHAQIGDIAEQYLFCNRKWDREDMKRLLIDQFRRDTASDPEFTDLWRQMSQIELAPSLDGSGTVALGIQSRRFPKKLASAFVEWLYAFGADINIRWSE